MGSFLTRDQILESKDFYLSEVECPEWGGTVRVRSLSAAEFNTMGFGTLDKGGNVDARLSRDMMTKIASWGIIDADGNRVFSNKDVKVLGGKNYAPVNRVAEKILDMTYQNDEESEEDEEETPKNE